MKIFIDGEEIKTVLSGANISGSLSIAARILNFSFINVKQSSKFPVYDVHVGSRISVDNNEGKTVFRGLVMEVGYDLEKSSVAITAEDYLALLINSEIKGRIENNLKEKVKEKFNQKLKSLNIKFEFFNKLKKILTKEYNFLSLGKFSLYDFLHFVLTKKFGHNFKIYIDGEGSLKVLCYPVTNSCAKLKIGENIISCTSNSKHILFTEDIVEVLALGNEEVVSGKVVEIEEPENKISGKYLVEFDRHIYSDIYLMQLGLRRLAK